MRWKIGYGNRDEFLRILFNKVSIYLVFIEYLYLLGIALGIEDNSEKKDIFFFLESLYSERR